MSKSSAFTTSELLSETLGSRGEEYGAAWTVTGQLLSSEPLCMLLMRLIIKGGPYTFAWIMILNKLVRAATSPGNVDHWLDIAGYATLVCDDLRSKDDQKDCV